MQEKANWGEVESLGEGGRPRVGAEIYDHNRIDYHSYLTIPCPRT